MTASYCPDSVCQRSTTLFCYQCGEPCGYLFDDGRCCRCTRVMPDV